jgi:hypothetical protein
MLALWVGGSPAGRAGVRRGRCGIRRRPHHRRRAGALLLGATNCVGGNLPPAGPVDRSVAVRLIRTAYCHKGFLRNISLWETIDRISNRCRQTMRNIGDLDARGTASLIQFASLIKRSRRSTLVG